MILGWFLALFFGLGAVGALLSFDLVGLFVSGLLVWLGVVLIRRGRARRRASPQARTAPQRQSPSRSVEPQAAPVDRYRLVPAKDGFTKEAGEQRLRGAGFHIHTFNEGMGVTWRELDLQADGVLVATVAGARYRPKMLQSPVVQPGRPLRLVRDPNNEHDPNAVQVHAVSQAAETVVGYVPRGDAPAVAGLLDAGQDLHACVLWEWIGEDDKRDSVVMVVALPGVVQGV